VANNRQERTRRYLLGEMPEQEALEFEAQYFTDNDLFEEMTEAEDDLIESFVRGELTREEAQEFEEGYLTSHSRKAKVEFARALARQAPGPLKAADRSPGAQPMARPLFLFPRAAVAATAAVAVVTIASLAFVNLRLRRDLDQLRNQQSELQRRDQALRRQLAGSSGPQSPRSAQTASALNADSVSLVLIPGLQRASEGGKTLRIPAGTDIVGLQLLLERNEYPAYDASLETAEGLKVWDKKGLRAQKVDGAQAVTLILPAQLFKSIDYLVKLRGTSANGHVEDVADYHFVVAK
jgi:hypothetical protein